MKKRKNRKFNNSNENLNISETETVQENEISKETADSQTEESGLSFDDEEIAEEFDLVNDFSLDEETSDENDLPENDSENADESGKTIENNLKSFEISGDIYDDREHVGGSIEFLKDDDEPESGRFKRNHLHKEDGILLPFKIFFKYFYDFSYLLGIQTYRYGKWVFKRVHRIIMKPVRYIYALSRVLVLSIDRLFFKSIHIVHEEAVLFRKEIKSSAKYLRSAIKKDPLSIFSILIHYIRKTFTDHKNMFKSAFNLTMPVAALLVFLLTVNYWSGVTYALKVTYSIKNVSYIQDESVFIKAQSLASSLLDQNDDTGGTTDVNLGNPKYELALVKLNQLSDESVISENIIDSAENVETACGVYIDGEHMFSVKNEADATEVFENILKPYKEKNKNAIVAFVEDVKLKQGLYKDDNKMLDAAELTNKLKTKKTEAVYHVVKEGETVWDIANDNKLTEKELLDLNREFGDGSNLHIGDKLVVSNEVNFLRVKIIKTETMYDEIDYETITTNNSSLFRGDKRTIRKGVEGRDEVTALVTYIDGIVVGTPKEISRTRLEDPISEKVQVGTKSTMIYSQSGSYNVSVSREGFVWPVPSCHSVSSPFGYRSRGYHNGVDIAGSGTRGKIIVAAKDGVVDSVYYSGYGLGNYIIINHGNGIKTGYGHCLSGSISVSPGQHVSAGQAIARVGSTGNATGPHLHFNVMINGNHVNPIPYVN